MVNGPAAPTAVQDDEPLPGFNELLDEYNHYSPIVRAKIKKLKAQLGKESVSLRDFDRADRLMAERFYAVRDKLQMMNKLPKQHRKAARVSERSNQPFFVVTCSNPYGLLFNVQASNLLFIVVQVNKHSCLFICCSRSRSHERACWHVKPRPYAHAYNVRYMYIVLEKTDHTRQFA